MKKLLHFEKFSDSFYDHTPLKYIVGEYVKYKNNKRYLFEILSVDHIDYYKPYFIVVANNHSGTNSIIGDKYWVQETELYSDEETKLYNAQKNYNI